MNTGSNNDDPASSDSAPNGSSRDDTDDFDARRRSLEAKLAERQGVLDAKIARESKDAPPGMATALKLSSEFIAGIVAGGLIGYLLDRYAGTSPWGMIVFLLLGFAAGVLNVLRSAGLIAETDVHKAPGNRGEPGEKDK